MNVTSQTFEYKGETLCALGLLVLVEDRLGASCGNLSLDLEYIKSLDKLEGK